MVCVHCEEWFAKHNDACCDCNGCEVNECQHALERSIEQAAGCFEPREIAAND